jgi:anti-anti-sigma factor
MHISTSIQDDTAVLRLQGRFDFTGHRPFHDQVKRALASGAVRRIEIDLSGVEHLDSSELGMLLLCRDHAQFSAKTLSLVRATGTVKQVLEVANVQKLFA